MPTKHTKNNFYILTGAMGAGKSTLLQQLRQRNYMAIDEPARQILAEQRSIAGDGVPDKNERLFTELMLSRAMFQFERMQDQAEPVFFDRGVADNIAYAELFGFEFAAAKKAAQQYRYNNSVFFVAGWQEIYTTDDERTMSFAAAQQFGERVKVIYKELGYSVITVPNASPTERVEFILQTMGIKEGKFK